jgi:molecular chaperone HtpG
MSEENAQSNNYQFQAEVKQLLEILTHSLYTHRDVYIRELISNAADALDKVRIKNLKSEDIINPDLDFEINISLDKDNKTFTISDTGVGMTKEELLNNIGTIARSGTSEFVKQLKDSNDVNLIGRFGIGFYSVFMAGKKVEITSKSANKDEPTWLWESDGEGTFTIKEAEEKKTRGTIIKVFLRDDATEFAEKHQVQNIIEKYSNFVSFPIKLDGEQINNVSAIWREPKSNVTKEQYNEFYKFIAHQSDDAMTWMHLSADVPLQFNSLLYVPKTNMEFMGYEAHDEGIGLFVRRVMVDAHEKEILPKYLRFVRGVLESDDLPLNISRETLQENPHMFKIKNTMIAKFLSHLQDWAKNNPEEYEKYWNQHGRIFKEGYNDFANKEKVADLFRFNTSKCNSSDEIVSLETYIDRKQEKQEEIYYLSGPNREALENNPTIEIFKKKNIEVIYCFDPIDEFALPGLMDFKEKKIISADQVDLAKLDQVPSEEKDEKAKKKTTKKEDKDYDNLARRIKDILGDKVEDVKISERLVDSPAVLIGSAMSSQMEKIMAMYEQSNKSKPKVMEINKNHGMIKNMLFVYKQDVNDPVLAKAANNLFNSVLLIDGVVSDPHEMASGIQEAVSEMVNLYINKDEKKEEETSKKVKPEQKAQTEPEEQTEQEEQTKPKK